MSKNDEVIRRMAKKTFTIIGKKINNLEEFHDEVHRVLCPTFSSYGRNWNSLNDILRGGFGTFELDEEITIVFTSKKHIRKQLGENFLPKFARLVKQHKHIEFVIE